MSKLSVKPSVSGLVLIDDRRRTQRVKPLQNFGGGLAESRNLAPKILPDIETGRRAPSE